MTIYICTYAKERFVCFNLCQWQKD